MTRKYSLSLLNCRIIYNNDFHNVSEENNTVIQQLLNDRIRMRDGMRQQLLSSSIPPAGVKKGRKINSNEGELWGTVIVGRGRGVMDGLLDGRT